jgi:hypothetical protein
LSFAFALLMDMSNVPWYSTSEHAEKGRAKMQKSPFSSGLYSLPDREAAAPGKERRLLHASQPAVSGAGKNGLPFRGEAAHASSSRFSNPIYDRICDRAVLGGVLLLRWNGQPAARGSLRDRRVGYVAAQEISGETGICKHPHREPYAQPAGVVMKYSKNDFDAALKKAFAILGKDADVLAPDPDPLDLINEANKACGNANKTRNQLLKDIEAYEDALDKVLNASKLYENKVAKDKFKLDESKPDQKKKIIQARAILTGAMKQIDQEAKGARKPLDATEKSLSGEIK